ncbi:MAG: signal peptidase I [Candidatus Pacebacteria bacterium]|nr:signal peptidase I [Candidatus Paceibacterota bacterium]
MNDENNSLGQVSGQPSMQDNLNDTILEASEVPTGTPLTLEKYETEIYDVDGELNPVAPQNTQNHHKDGISWKFIFFIIIILLPIRLFVAEPFLVYGSSMEPNFDTGDYLIVDELSYRVSNPKRGDVVVLRPPTDETKHFIKRIVGLPNETIDVKGDQVTIYNAANPNGLLLKEPYLKFHSDKEAHFDLKDNEYFVMGDNRTVSYDSRSWGPLTRDHITGKAFLRLYPFNSISILPGDSSKFK